ncbi:energy transducer TonB [uncultured Chitinophaga sp.]|uniref:energy transducer TonB n=1 Tax=uncultured Chitinophaga sp. TaxID=339340 RepID=UPI0025F4F038|nr:energy transducer TonB [uncultured Chitinophaga sp.]
MDITKSTTPEFIDILFDGRNKNYGAYKHRVTYDKRVRNAIAGTASIALVIIGGYVLGTNLRAADVHRDNKPLITQTELIDVKIEEPKFIPPPPVKVEEPPVKIATEKFNTFRVTDEPVAPEEEVVKISELENKVIANARQDGEDGSNEIAALLEKGGNNTGIVANETIKEDPNKVHIFVEIPPEFPGGEAALNKFLQRNISYPAVASDNGIQGIVSVSFVVGKTGEISEVKILSLKKGGGLEEEAIRVVRKMPKWKPGRQNGQNVNVQFNLPVNFRLAEQ